MIVGTCFEGFVLVWGWVVLCHLGSSLPTVRVATMGSRDLLRPLRPFAVNPCVHNLVGSN